MMSPRRRGLKGRMPAVRVKGKKDVASGSENTGAGSVRMVPLLHRGRGRGVGL